MDDVSVGGKLMGALRRNKEECVDSGQIELLWGDIQLGKRTHACIIMWISVHVLKRPVLYIFRNLKIDQKQLQEDIAGTGEYNFNIQFIKRIFDKYRVEMATELGEDPEAVDYWKDFKLPELRDINTTGVVEKLSDKDGMNSNDVFCCLMNHKQLKKIDDKMSEYIVYNKRLLNLTLLVDESDLYSPTGCNDHASIKASRDEMDVTQCEQCLASLYYKAKYTLHITGTAHSLLSNVTTKLLGENMRVHLPITRVHKMRRRDDYYGLFNRRVTFQTQGVCEWWKGDNKYTILQDYETNICRILSEIRGRTDRAYSSFLISEEKVRRNHLSLAQRILNDFEKLFVVVFHGNCLRLYLPKELSGRLKQCAIKDASSCKTSRRLDDVGGIHGSGKDTVRSGGETLKNGYCYYEVNAKRFTIKQVYKVLAMLFVDYEQEVQYKTVVTITGKYGERGYSFTSDDYGKYRFHLTDQYFPCHTRNKNCTDISQRLRLQGKYSDSPRLTLWTSQELKNLIMDFYVPFMTAVEANIMACETWDDIRELIEGIVSNGTMQIARYIRYSDVGKKTKNLSLKKRYDRVRKGFKLTTYGEMMDDEIEEWCSKHTLPPYVCVNVVNRLAKTEFIKRFGECEMFTEVKSVVVPSSSVVHCYPQVETGVNEEVMLEELNGLIEEHMPGEPKLTKSWVKRRLSRFNHETGKWFDNNAKGGLWKELRIQDVEQRGTRLDRLKEHGESHRYHLCYSTGGDLVLVLHKTTLLSTKVMPKNTMTIQPGGRPYVEENGEVVYSETTVSGELPTVYYWKSPEGWLYLRDTSKGLNDLVSVEVAMVTEGPPQETTNVVVRTTKRRPLCPARVYDEGHVEKVEDSRNGKVWMWRAYSDQRGAKRWKYVGEEGMFGGESTVTFG